MFKIDLLENETVLNIYRQTESVLFRPVLTVFVLIYFPWYFLLKYELAGSYIKLLFLWTILVFLYAARKYLLWQLNVYLLTNKRIISVSYSGLFSKKVLESPMDKILNVSFSAKGFWQTLFKFGSVEVQVAGLAEPIVLKNLPHPSAIKDFIWKTHANYSKNAVI